MMFNRTLATLAAASLAVLLTACGSCQDTPDDPVQAASEVDLGELPAEAERVQVSLTVGGKERQLRVPPGFSVKVFAQVPNARSMTRGAKGTVFVGNRKGDSVYAVVDSDGDGVAETRHTIAGGLRMPNGVAFRQGALYVAEVSRVLRFDDIEARLTNPPAPVVVRDTFPTDAHHGWKFIGLGPDDKLYVPVGAPCNVCDRDADGYSNIQRMNPDGSGLETVARGVRNTVGFTWHPTTGELWFTDNGRDNMGDNVPPDELNRVTAAGQHFGYPFVHGANIKDPDFWPQRPPGFSWEKPAKNLAPHCASLGVIFYNGAMLPAAYRGRALIAEHGSWNRSKRIGYRLSMVTFDDAGKATGYEPLVDGFLAGDDVWGRPASVLELPDGSVLLSDDFADVIYRITYAGP